MAEFKSQDEKTKQAFSMIEQGVKDVYSSESFKQYLSCLSKFHSYSLNNTLLILSQKPEASLVAGYRAWQTNFNRHVNKGEKGLMILAPVTTKEDRLMNKHDENGNVILDESGNPVQEMRVVNLTHFKTTTVFDISQTSGDPLPSLVHDLTGSSNEVKAIIQTIQSVCTISIEFKTNQRIIAGNAQFTGIAAGQGVGFTTGLLHLRKGLGMRETPIRPHSWH